MSIVIINGEVVLSPSKEEGGVYLSQIAKIENGITLFPPEEALEEEEL